VQSEIDRKPEATPSLVGPSAVPVVDVGDDVIKQLFQGELISEVWLWVAVNSFPGQFVRVTVRARVRLTLGLS